VSRRRNGDGGPVAGAAAKSVATTLTDLETIVRREAVIGEHRRVLATAYCVHGRTGRLRTLLVVRRCPFCGAAHSHTAGPTFEGGKRTPSCHLGRYVVVAAVARAAA
jgi:hypothetical protein